MELLIHLSTIILIAYLLGIAFEKIKLTRILAYILVGIIAGPYLGNWITVIMIQSLTPLIGFAIIFIALLIGMKLKVDELKKLEKEVFLITFIQAFATFLSVAIFIYITLLLFNMDNALSIGLMLGTVAMATAPATVMAVVEEFRARGPLTTLLLAIVAIDDAIAIVLFSVILVIVSALSGEGASVGSLISLPLNELMLPAVVGSFAALFFFLIGKMIKDQTVLAIFLILTMLMLFYFSESFNMTALIPAMILGFVASNFNGLKEETAEKITKAEDFLFIIFFVTAGAHLDLSVVSTVGFFALVYVLSRWAGKVLGGSFGAYMAGSEEKIRRWLGWGLLPQAGVAIVLTHLISRYVPQISGIIISIVLASIVLDEIIGPLGVELAIFRTGEARERR
ncbi:MAG: cation:proton antiporter [Candidatus Margulisbacteria bacterium]|nr:cation:proton antiporter [Candidatus Margulisiibacteriota bacterium]